MTVHDSRADRVYRAVHAVHVDHAGANVGAAPAPVAAERVQTLPAVRRIAVARRHGHQPACQRYCRRQSPVLPAACFCQGVAFFVHPCEWQTHHAIDSQLCALRSQRNLRPTRCFRLRRSPHPRLASSTTSCSTLSSSWCLCSPPPWRDASSFQFPMPLRTCVTDDHSVSLRRWSHLPLRRR